MDFPRGSAVKNPPAMQKMQEMRVPLLGQEDPLEKGTATHSSILAWRIPWTEEPGGLQSMGRPLLLLPPNPPSIRVFSNESTLPIRWPKYWSFSFSIIPSKEIPGLISFRMDWLDLLAV